MLQRLNDACLDGNGHATGVAPEMQCIEKRLPDPLCAKFFELLNGMLTSPAAWRAVTRGRKQSGFQPSARDGQPPWRHSVEPHFPHPGGI